MPDTKGVVVKKGALLSITIDSVAFGGQGVGRHGDLVVFVPFTVDGDEGLIEVAEVKKSYVRGALKTLTAFSPWRTEPPCAVYGRCGGCQYQHVTYDHQLALKRQHIQDAFARIGKFIRIPLRDIIPSPSPWHYRGKAEFHVTRTPDQTIVVGLARAASHEILDISHCEIVAPDINDDLVLLRRRVQATSKKKIDQREVLWSSEGSAATPPGYIGRMVKGRELLVPRRSFFQANRLLAETLLDVVLEMCALTGVETVIDSYCGSGFFSVFLVPGARIFYGIEFAGDAVRAADMNVKTAGFDQALFYEGDVGHVLKDVFVKARQRVDVLVLDPPRIGLGLAVLSTVTQLRPSRIVYVSCNPATMARDIHFLADHGYTLEVLQPLDMFPQTSHIEVVGLLTIPPNCQAGNVAEHLDELNQA